jgi:hypothetical protein
MKRFLVNLLKVKESRYYIDIEIDRLTNSVTNTISKGLPRKQAGNLIGKLKPNWPIERYTN